MSLAVPGYEAVAAAAQGGDAGPAPPDKNIVYGKAGDVELHCDVYRPPAAAAKRMAIVHCHGGGFTGGSKDNLAARLKALTARGYVNIATQYRLGGVAKWPAQIEDVKASIRWARLHAADLGVDPRRIAVAGYSAGGHLALFAAGTQNRPEFEGNSGNSGPGTEVAACIAFYAVTNPAVSGEPPHRGHDESSRLAMPGTIKSFPPTVSFTAWRM